MSANRTVNTICALVGEPEGTVILTAHGLVMKHDGDGYWLRTGSYTDYQPIVDWLPATVLYEPK